jgi:hypothetical protein
MKALKIMNMSILTQYFDAERKFALLFVSYLSPVRQRKANMKGGFSIINNLYYQNMLDSSKT